MILKLHILCSDECAKLNVKEYSFPSLEKLTADIEASEQNFSLLQDFNKGIVKLYFTIFNIVNYCQNNSKIWFMT